jgi:starch synthase
LNVLFVSAEMSPLAKVGGLGDVAGSLPRALRSAGVDVRVAIPFYRAIDRSSMSLHRVTQVDIGTASGDLPAEIWRTRVHDVPVYLVENEAFFGRERVYGHEDDLDRFLFFCDALVSAAPALGFTPDVIHAQDWHAALLLTRVSAIRESGAASHPFARCGSVYTIHNLALKGEFTREWAAGNGVAPAQLAPPDGLPRDIALSCMSQGILRADRVNTVSETYAREILTPEFGAGLDHLLRARSSVVSGIVNGIDYEEFDPTADQALARRFDVTTLDARVENKRWLQREAGLPARDDVLLFGVVTRLFAQKGIDLVATAFEALLGEHDAQLVVLGTGDEAVHDLLRALQGGRPDKVKIWLDFNAALGQRIYGGCDCFLMPSRYEPCGLGQMISLRYGALPLVRRTGGLADTVTDADAAPDTGTGFVFDAATAADLRAACERALAAFAEPARWRAIQARGMRQDWSWHRAAPKYVELYQAAAERRRAVA